MGTFAYIINYTSFLHYYRINYQMNRTKTLPTAQLHVRNRESTTKRVRLNIMAILPASKTIGINSFSIRVESPDGNREHHSHGETQSYFIPKRGPPTIYP